MNNKGFTTIEIILTFALVVIILMSMYGIIISYRDRVEKEQILSNLNTFKNTMTKIVYDDIIDGSVIGASSCGDKCVELTTSNSTYTLEVDNKIDGSIYLKYNETDYLIPDSNLELITVDDFIVNFNNIDQIYTISIPINHIGINASVDINIAITK